MAITIDTKPEIETQRRAEAAKREGFTAPVMTEEWRTSWKAAFDALLEGDADEQRETLTLLKKAVDADRPGQRSVFGTGINPDK